MQPWIALSDVDSSLSGRELCLTQHCLEESSAWLNAVRKRAPLDSALSGRELRLTQRCPEESSAWLKADRKRAPLDSALSYTAFRLTAELTRKTLQNCSIIMAIWDWVSEHFKRRHTRDTEPYIKKCLPVFVWWKEGVVDVCYREPAQKVC